MRISTLLLIMRYAGYILNILKDKRSHIARILKMPSPPLMQNATMIYNAHYILMLKMLLWMKTQYYLPT